MLVRRIQMKTSPIPGELPGVMEHGEIAVNIPDSKMYVGVGGSSPPIEIGGGGGGTLTVVDAGTY